MSIHINLMSLRRRRRWFTFRAEWQYLRAICAIPERYIWLATSTSRSASCSGFTSRLLGWYARATLAKPLHLDVTVRSTTFSLAAACAICLVFAVVNHSHDETSRPADNTTPPRRKTRRIDWGGLARSHIPRMWNLNGSIIFCCSGDDYALLHDRRRVFEVFMRFDHTRGALCNRPCRDVVGRS